MGEGTIVHDEVRTSWRRVVAGVVVVFASAAFIWLFVQLDGAQAWGALAVGAVVVAVFGRRLMWSRAQWEQHLGFRHRVAREHLRAEAGQRGRPPMW